MWALSAGGISGDAYSGSMNRYGGGAVLGGSYAPATSLGSVGQVALRFTTPTTGFIAFPGEMEKAISKFVW